MEDVSNQLLIVGASTRAAAWSARRAGYQPLCVDQFGDSDLRAVAQVATYDGDLDQCINRASEWIRILRKSPGLKYRHRPHAPLFTGPFENHTNLLCKLWQSLWFKSEDDLHCFGDGVFKQLNAIDELRSATCVSRWLEAARLPALAVHSHEFRSAGFDPLSEVRRETSTSINAGAPARNRDQWIQKPHNSGGGFRIHDVAPEVALAQIVPTGFYWQRKALGISMSALFMGWSAGCDLIGTVKVLTGDPACPEDPYLFKGCVGPFPADSPWTSQIRAIGTHLYWQSRIRGLFGIDFIWDGTTAWPVEVNPRYTASAELYELAYEVCLLPSHLSALEYDAEGEDIGQNTLMNQIRKGPIRLVGKRICYAAHECVWPVDEGRFTTNVDALLPFEVPHLADIPAAGTRFQRRYPVCTVMAEVGSSGTVTELERLLEVREAACQ